MEPYSPEVEWMVIIGLVISFVLAFGIGANDVANSFGTSVGSGTLTLMQACILATIFENAGAILIGQKVADTVRKGIVDVTIYDGAEKELMLGCVAALASSAIFLLGSTFLNLPVSSTQSIIGSTVGFSLVARGTRGLGWPILVKTFISWIISPVLSGCVSILFFLAIYKFILIQRNPLRAGLRSLPIFYGITVFVNVYSILLNGQKLYYKEHPPWKIVFISLGCGTGAALASWLYVVPFQRDRILRVIILKTYEEKLIHEEAERIDAEANQRESKVSSQPETGKGNRISKQLDNSDTLFVDEQNNSDVVTKDDKKKNLERQRRIACKKAETVSMLFTYLQNLSACFASFAHGGNDVSNAIAPLISINEIYTLGSIKKDFESYVPVLLYGTVGITVGLWIWGPRVIKTIGNDLTKITAVSGFTVSFCSAFTVLVATAMGFPISTTHCVGSSVVAVGFINSKLAKLSIGEEYATSCMNAEVYRIDWRLSRHMIYAWIVTLPVTIIISGGVYGIIWGIFYATTHHDFIN